MWSCSSLWSSSQQRMVTHSFLLFITYIVQNGWQSPNQLFLFLGDTSWSWFLNKKHESQVLQIGTESRKWKTVVRSANSSESTACWRHGIPAKRANKQNSDAFQCFDLAILYGFLVKSWGTLIQRNRLYSSWLIPSKLYESVTCWGSNHGANSNLPMIPLQA